MFTQKLSMDCTQEQYEKYLKEELLKMGYDDTEVTFGEEETIIVNNTNERIGNLSTLIGARKERCGRTYLGSFNAPLFLALAAMTDKEYGVVGEWWIKINGGVSFSEGELYKAGTFYDDDHTPSFIDDTGLRNGLLKSDFHTQLRKASVAEIMTKFQGQKASIEERLEKIEKFISELPYKEEEPKEWLPKRGDYYRVRLCDTDWICIASGEGPDAIRDVVSFWFGSGRLYYDSTSPLFHDFYPATPSEIALLDSKLAEQGKKFDKEKCELVDIEKKSHKNCFYSNVNCFPLVGICDGYSKWKPIPKYKEPIIGEMAIFWDTDKLHSFCRVYAGFNIIGGHKCIGIEMEWDNAILFESPEQYKEFLKS